MEFLETEKIRNLTGQVKDYIQTRIDIATLSAVKTGSRAAGNAALYILVGVLGLFFLMFISIGAAIGIGHAIDSIAGGFMIVSAFYLLLGIVCFIFREQLIMAPITKAVINGVLNKEEEKS